MQPRVYTYKITFEEIPHWYWGVHKEGKFNDGYMGSPRTHKWMWEFYTPRIQILEFFPYTKEGWEEANRVEDRLICHDFNNPLNLNEHWGSFVSLPCRSKGGKASAEKLNQEKDEQGRSVNARRGGLAAGPKSAIKVNREKDEQGRSVNAVKGGQKSAKALHKDKDVSGKSWHGVKSAGRMNSQLWESLVDGFRNTPGNVARHNKANGWDPDARIRVK